MKNYKKRIYCLCIIIAILLALILVVLCFNIKLEIPAILKNQLFWTIITLVISISVSIITHLNIINRNKRINTITEFSKIRTKYRYLGSCATKEKKIKYLQEMEFFCTGINEKVFDLNIVNKMSGGLLVKQYDSYMKKFAFSRKTKKCYYENYLSVMERLKQIRSEKSCQS